MSKNGHLSPYISTHVRPEKFQFLEKWQNCNFDYKIVISVKKSVIYSLDLEGKNGLHRWNRLTKYS